MELEKFSRQLRLLLLLVKNRKQTIDEVSAQLGMSRRSMYRYIDAFRKLGFIIKKGSSDISSDTTVMQCV